MSSLRAAIRNIVIATAALAAGIGLAHAQQQQHTQPPDSTQSVPGTKDMPPASERWAMTEPLTDRAFIENAMQNSLLETTASQLVQRNTRDPQVREYAGQIIADHTRAVSELKKIALEQNVKLPTSLDASHKKELERLKGLKGDEMDAAYSGVMTASHDKAMELFQQASQNKHLSPSVQSFAQRTLPTLQAHSRMASKLHQREGRSAEAPSESEPARR
jgi:putative membrane protein